MPAPIYRHDAQILCLAFFVYDHKLDTIGKLNDHFTLILMPIDANMTCFVDGSNSAIEVRLSRIVNGYP
jgi:hypothetical protein